MFEKWLKDLAHNHGVDLEKVVLVDDGEHAERVTLEEVDVREKEWYSTQVDRIPARFRLANVTQLEPVVRAAVEGCVDQGVGAFMFGNTGLGKSHAAAAMAKLMLAKHMPLYWLNTAETLYLMRESFNGGEKAAALSKIRSIKTLVIDDIGVENPSEWAIETLNVIVNTAYEGGVTLIVTSNLTTKELAARIGPRIVGRIYEVCKTIKFEGRNRRLGGVG